MTSSNQSFAIGKYVTLICFFFNTLQASTTFTIQSNLLFDAASGDELTWLNNHTDVSGSGAPYTIIIQAGAQWNIHAAEFNTHNLGGDVVIIIEGQTDYPTGAQLFFTGNGSKLLIQGFDAVYVSASNETGLDAWTHLGHIKVETDCEEYKGNQLDDIVAEGGVTGNCEPVTAGVSLPVEWSAFTVVLEEGKSLLKWSTASEINNDRFVISHSEDGIRFTTIGEVSGAGTSNVENTYYFLDDQPIVGMNYYRIKQIDLDGAEHTSAVVSVRVEDVNNTPSIKVAGNNLMVLQEAEMVFSNTVFIFNMGGQMVGQFKIVPGAVHSYDLSGLTTGMYVVSMQVGGQPFSTKIFKS